jgi:hypothetical protein
MDPLNILGQDFDIPPTFDEAVRVKLNAFHAAVERFSELYERVPDENFTDAEWRVVELATEDLEGAVERAEEGYVAVQYDSHAWYRIMENLDTITRRLESTIGLMNSALERADTP